MNRRPEPRASAPESAVTQDAWRIVGGRPLAGTVRPSGSKNGSLPTLAATLLLDGETVLRNIPRITDVATMISLLRALGLTVDEEHGGSVRIINRGLTSHRPPEDLAGLMRASHYVLGPIVLRLREAEMALPGGCRIGARPVAHILAVLETLGVRCELRRDSIALRSSGLRGAPVSLDPQHRNPGATFTALMAASLADGETIIENASFEPDVVRFCQFLQAAGASIDGVGRARLTVRGRPALHGASHRLNADRLEAGTFICAAAATRGEVLVEDIARADLGAAADKLQEAGMEIEQRGESLRANCPRRLRGVEVVTDPFPLFSTDLQPPVAAVLATAEGRSRVRETVFDRRLQYAGQLRKMGAQIELVSSREAVITGVPRLHGAEVEAENIRDGAALVVAALGADGETLVSGKRFVARGYEGLDRKLRALGARITEIGDGEG